MPDESLNIANIVADSLNMPRKGNVDLLSEDFPAEALLPELTVEPASNGAISRPVPQPVSTEALTIEDIQLLKSLLPDLKQAHQEIKESRACQAFIDRHGPNSPLPFVPCPESQEVMFGWLRDHGLPITLDNLERCYNELNGVTPQTAAVQPIVKPMSTGLPDTVHPTHLHETSDLSDIAAEIHNMPLEQARTRITQLMRQQRQGR